MTGTVRVVGEVMIDTVAYTTGPLAHGSDTPAVIAEHSGGSAANVAAWLAHVGVPVELIASVGTDEAGSRAILELEAAGVSARIVRHPELPTGRCVVIVGPDGERTMMPDPGANANLDAGGVLASAWSAVDHLHVSGYSLLRPGSRQAAVTAIARAEAMGLGISVDASSAAPLAAVGPQALLDCCPAETIVFANADEAEALTDEPDPASAAAALASRGLIAVVKAGARGAFAARATQRWAVDALRVPVIDTTGAGDAFAAGFLFEWRTSRDVSLSLDAATRLAAHAVGVRGARP